MTTTFIDTHCHLEMDAFQSDRDSVVNRAREKGIEYIISVGSDWKGNMEALKASRNFPGVYAAVGIHPHDAETFDNKLFLQVKKWSEEPGVIAIGEIGLDYHYMHSPKETQRDVFIKQIQIAGEAFFPIIVHSREAKNDTLNILQKEASGVAGVLHCFSGDTDMARRAMDLGFYLSLAGPVTFRNAKKLQEVAKFIPDERLLIETDAPYLSPVPMRGKRNEPSFLVYTAQAIADIRGVTLSDIARITTLNAKKLFRIGQMPERGEIAYKIRDSLYLNITKRCTNSCGFCVRFHKSYVKGHNLDLQEEPSAEEVIEAIGDPKTYREVVFCGLGEPLLRLDIVKEVSTWIKQRGGIVRINTNGHGNLIHKRNILPELKGIVDSLSISLDAEDEKTYEQVCRPSFKNAFNAVVSFIRDAKEYIPEVMVTVVDIPEINIHKCKALAEELGIDIRIRKMNVVG